MNLTAKEIATRYAGRTVKCKVVTSAPVLDDKGNKLDYFDAKILGWKAAGNTPTDPFYVCVEVLAPGVTELKLSKFNLGYHYTADRNSDGWGKKLLPEEIVPPADPGTIGAPKKSKVIPEWPDKCRDCGSPAYVGSFFIDCSNATCKNKYKTKSGLDLFLPKEMQEALAKKKEADALAALKKTKLFDADGILICAECKQIGSSYLRAVMKGGVLGPTLDWSDFANHELKMTCDHNHKCKVKIVKGDKVKNKSGKIVAWKGTTFA